MKELYLLAKIGKASVAIQCDLVESVVRINEVVPVPRSRPSVAGLFALRSRVLTLIDPQIVVHGERRLAPEKAEKDVACEILAVIARLGEYSYAFMVEAVNDVVTVNADDIDVHVDPGMAWRPFVKGAAMLDGEMIMILDLQPMVAGQDSMAA